MARPSPHPKEGPWACNPEHLVLGMLCILMAYATPHR